MWLVHHMSMLGFLQEARASLRMLLLQLFGLLCELEIEVVSVLLNSVLPNELGRDIHDNMEGLH